MIAENNRSILKNFAWRTSGAKEQDEKREEAEIEAKNWSLKFDKIRIISYMSFDLRKKRKSHIKIRSWLRISNRFNRFLDAQEE